MKEEEVKEEAVKEDAVKEELAKYQNATSVRLDEEETARMARAQRSYRCCAFLLP